MQKGFQFEPKQFYYCDIVHLFGMQLCRHNEDSSFTPVGTEDKFYFEAGDIQAFQPEIAISLEQTISSANRPLPVFDATKEIIIVNTRSGIYNHD